MRMAEQNYSIIVTILQDNGSANLNLLQILKSTAMKV